MKRILSLVLIVSLFLCTSSGLENKSSLKVKNIILMIPDGTSLATVSLARWIMNYENNRSGVGKLNLDPYLCGTVITHSSNAPIGDSAPTTSCYMTGYPSQTAFVSTYPPADPANDIYPVDNSKAYRPLATVLEAARWTEKKATGLVVTCEFPHATPADCAAHSYKRDKYEWIAPQMAHNGLDVVIGGGVSCLYPGDERYLIGKGYSVHKNNIEGMRKDTNTKMWALFGSRTMDYEIDRDPSEQPSLAEMTGVAIGKLQQSPNGFFLMVEGSRIDHAAHANDAITMVREMLAFDEACKVALNFARQDGNTAVVILPDHGNSGISIGIQSNARYDRMTKSDLFANLSRFKYSSGELARRIDPETAANPSDTLFRYTGIRPSRADLDAISQTAKQQGRRAAWVNQWRNSHTYIGFTTGGHTAEEVFLAAYHPNGNIPQGVYTNIEINHYLCSLLGITHSDLDGFTNKYYAPHKEVFPPDKYDCKISVVPGDTTLTVTNRDSKKQIVIPSYTNLSILKAKPGARPDTTYNTSVAIYVDATGQFYIDNSLRLRLDR
ncbi:MAG: alkaline phosphatase [Tannerellaceae bacterium]|jgi:alkaline phosphatase|nr:alkaline phosphatase [Tannerellaceae bacterium]